MTTIAAAQRDPALSSHHLHLRPAVSTVEQPWAGQGPTHVTVKTEAAGESMRTLQPPGRPRRSVRFRDLLLFTRGRRFLWSQSIIHPGREHAAPAWMETVESLRQTLKTNSSCRRWEVGLFVQSTHENTDSWNCKKMADLQISDRKSPPLHNVNSVGGSGVTCSEISDLDSTCVHPDLSFYLSVLCLKTVSIQLLLTDGGFRTTMLGNESRKQVWDYQTQTRRRSGCSSKMPPVKNVSDQ